MARAIAERRGTVFCALETYLYPHTALFKSGAAYLDAPVRVRCGWGAAHRNHQERSPYEQEREQASNQTCRVRAQGRCAPMRSPTQAVPHARARCPGSAHRDPV